MFASKNFFYNVFGKADFVNSVFTPTFGIGHWRTANYHKICHRDKPNYLVTSGHFGMDISFFSHYFTLGRETTFCQVRECNGLSSRVFGETEHISYGKRCGFRRLAVTVSNIYFSGDKNTATTKVSVMKDAIKPTVNPS